MKILVTGGLGFLGSHLTDGLVGAGHDVLALDDQSTSCQPPHESQARFWLGSIECWDSLQDTRASLIIHCASPVGVRRIESTWPFRIVSDAACVARWAENQKAKVIFLSSCEIYGLQTSVVRDRTPASVAFPMNARTVYQAGKLAAEALFVAHPNLAVDIVRPVNVAGPRQQPDGGFVLPNFIRQALNGESLTVFAPGTQQRDFLWVGDFVNFCLKLMERPPAPGEKRIYNVANQENRTTMTGLADMVIRTVRELGGKPGGIEIRQGPPDRPFVCVDTRLAREDLGWAPKVGLRGIVEETVVWWLKQDNLAGSRNESRI